MAAELVPVPWLIDAPRDGSPPRIHWTEGQPEELDALIGRLLDLAEAARRQKERTRTSANARAPDEKD